jgi:hypothetical protein
VLALVALLVAECHVSRRKVQGLLLHLLGIRVSLGTLSESEEIVSDAVDAAVEQARGSTRWASGSRTSTRRPGHAPAPTGACGRWPPRP